MDFIKENRAALAVVAIIAGLLVSGVVINQNEMQQEQQKNETAQNEADNKDAKKSDKNVDKDAKDASKEDKAATNEDNESEMTQTDDAVNFTVAAGESYTTLARKAVQAHDAELSKARVIAAETFLAQGAGEPAVDVGQEVEMKQSDIEAAVKKAKNLSDADIAAWRAYVPYVQF